MLGITGRRVIYQASLCLACSSYTLQRLLDPDFLPIYGIAPLMRCTQVEDQEIVRIARQILANYVSNPNKLGAQGWSTGLEPSLIPFLPISTPEVLEVAGPQGQLRAIDVLQQYSTPRPNLLGLTDVVTLQLCCKWLEYDPNRPFSELLDQVWSITGQSLIALLASVLEKTVDTLYEGILPTGGSLADTCSTELLAQLLRLSLQLTEMIRSHLPADPLEARLATSYITQTVRLRIVAGIISDCRPEEDPLTDAVEETLRHSTKALRAMVKHADWDISFLIQALEECGSSLPLDATILASQHTRVFQLFWTLLDDSDDDSDAMQSVQGFAAVRGTLFKLMGTMHLSEQLTLVGCLAGRDQGRVGIRDWYLQQVVLSLDEALSRLAGYSLVLHRLGPEDELKIDLLRRTIVKSLAFLDGSVENSSDGIHDDGVVEEVAQFLVSESAMGPVLLRCYKLMLDHDISTYSTYSLAEHLLPVAKGTSLFVPFLVTLLRSLRLQPPPVVFSDQLQLLVIHVVDEDSLSDGDLSKLPSELGYALAEMAADETMVHWGEPTAAARYVVQLLEYLRDRALSAVQDVQMEEDVEDLSRVALEGLSEDSFQRLAELADPVMPIDSRPLSSFAPYMKWSSVSPTALQQPLDNTHDVSTTARTLIAALQGGVNSPRPSTPVPSTPPSILGMGEYLSIVLWPQRLTYYRFDQLRCHHSPFCGHLPPMCRH